MPSPHAFFRASGALPSAIARVARVAGMATIVAVALFSVLLLAVRFVVFPRMEDYRDDLTAALARQLKQPVEIDRLATGWDGWNPKVVIHGFRVRSGAGPASSALLDLPQVEMVVAWTSLPLFDLRLKRLVLEQPRLAVRRDRGGMLHIAGMEFDPSQMGDDAPLTEWILRQPHIDVHDALITWNDDLRNAPQLVLHDVQLRLESRFGRHRFGLLGTPPSELAAPIDVRGDVRRGPHGDWQQATGKMYVRLDYADIAASSEWLPLPVPIARGKGALRVWFDFAAGEAREIVADLELAAVKAKLGPELPDLELASLSGRVGWRVALPRREFYTQALAFVTAEGQPFEPTDLKVTLREAAGNGAATGLIEFDRLQLAPLRDLMVHLPMPERVRKDLALYAPRGTLTRGRILWEGRGDSPDIYSAVAEFSSLGVAAQGAMPGVEGLSGRVEMTQATGDVKLASRNGAIQLPQVFSGPIAFDSLAGDFNWTRTGGRTAIEIKRLEFANPDAAGHAAGKLRTLPDGPGEIELNARLTRANVAELHRYLPLGVEAARDWLRSGLAKGTSPDVKLKLAGNLAEFPFPGGKGGTFTVTAKARDVVLDYAQGWPSMSELDFDVSLTGTKLTIDATRARVSGVPLGKIRAEIPNLRADHPLLVVAGEVAAPTADFLRFVDASPVAGWLDHVTDGAQATGESRLGLKLTFPLGDAAGNKIAGEFQFINNELRLVGAPLMTQVNGRLAFTEASVRAQELSVDVLGGPARFAIASAGGETRVTGSGTSTLAALRREFNPPYGDVLSGSLDWTMASAIKADGSTWTIESNLKGSTIDLPAPVGKPAGDAIALKLERRGIPAQPKEDALTITYGKVGRLLLHRKLGADGATVDRALVVLGRAVDAGPAERPERPGVWVRGELPTLNFDDWLALRRRATPGTGKGSEPALAGVDLEVGALEAFGRRFNEMRVSARRSQDDWRLDLLARELAGTATWSAPSTDAPNGRFVARLGRLVPPDAGELTPWKGAADGAGKTEAGGANPWPAIDIVADSYYVRGREVGRLEFVAHPRGTEWRIDKMRLANDSGRVSAEGQWQAAGKDQQTKLDVDLDLDETGKFLSRLGYADAVQNAPTRVKGQLAWAGAPNDFDYPTLSGAFRIDVGPGRFTKIEPGIGKLLGVLSLQSLPRRITLDFTDVFSEGFAFDEITGDVRIQNGVLMSDDLRLAGPAAKVNISGTADLAKETQQLTVRVQPALSAGVSAGAMLFLLANPLVGAAVGAGSLLAQKVLRDPIEQMFSYEYQVTGSWSDPVVERKTAVAATAGTDAVRK
jgi:uncharacterized protein (TIGR02099 family)